MFDRCLSILVYFMAVAAVLLSPINVLAIPKTGNSLPLFTVSTPSGQQVSNQNYSGRVLLLVFSTDYCSACKKAVPAIVKLADRYGKQEFHVLGLFSGSGMEGDDLKKYMNAYGVTYPMAIFEERLAKEQFGMVSVPYSLLVDKKGKVSGVYYGYSDGIMKQIEDQIKKNLVE